LEPAVFKIVRHHFDSSWMDDAHVRLIREDGRNYLAHTSHLYDVISLEAGQIFRPGVGAFYTADFYRRAAQKLSPGGLLVQFVPLPFLEESLRIRPDFRAGTRESRARSTSTELEGATVNPHAAVSSRRRLIL
jgi:spermidine synthase